MARYEMRAITPIPRAERIERRVQRCQHFDRNGNMTDLLAVLRAERFTGQVRIHFGQGAINAVEAEDSHILPEPD